MHAPPPLSPLNAAQRLNVFTGAHLALMQGVVGGLRSGMAISKSRDYSDGLRQRAGGRITRTHSTLNLFSMRIREQLAEGEQWWADLSPKRPQDWEGNRYTRTFAEEKTACVVLQFCPDKTTASFIHHLEEMERWVELNVSGGKFRVLAWTSDLKPRCKDEARTVSPVACRILSGRARTSGAYPWPQARPPIARSRTPSAS